MGEIFMLFFRVVHELHRIGFSSRQYKRSFNKTSLKKIDKQNGGVGNYMSSSEIRLFHKTFKAVVIQFCAPWLHSLDHLKR
jgi:hypothetical protein